MQTRIEIYKTGNENHLHVFVHEDITYDMIAEYLYNIIPDRCSEFVFIVSDRMLFSKLGDIVRELRNTYILVKYNLVIMSEPIPLRAGLYDYVLIADDYNKVKTVYMKVGGNEWNPAFADVTDKYMQEGSNLFEQYDKTDYPTYYKVEE